MIVPALQTIAEVFTERLLNTAAAGFVLAGLVWMLLRLVGRQNSGTRFAIWFSALLAIVALPFLPWSGFMASSFPPFHPASPRGPFILSSALGICLFAAWAVGAALLLLRLSVGLWRVRRLRRNCVELDLATLGPEILSILRDFNSRRRVKLCVSNDAAVPAAIGFFRPAIVFPAWLVPQLSSAEMKTILLHELAHLRRGDDWTNLAQKVFRALFFFHPAVWWIEDRLTLEREMACDEIVLAQTASPKAYASSLISFAERMQSARGLALAQALVSRMHQMSLRVAQILDAKRPNRTGLSKPVMVLSATIVAAVLAAAPFMPKFVAFQTQSNPSPTPQIQVAQQMMNTEHSAGSAIVRPTAEHVAVQSGGPSQPRTILAAYHPRAAVASPHVKVTKPHHPVVVLTRASQQQAPVQETIFILRTTQFDASGSGIWTLCIWRVGGTNQAARQLESAIFVSSI
jgi:beta-lactamase regulating signal transducer with metallopeptidase domain